MYLFEHAIIEKTMENTTPIRAGMRIFRTPTERMGKNMHEISAHNTITFPGLDN